MLNIKTKSIPKLLLMAVVGSTISGGSHALEMGFEGFLSYELRQNTDPVNFPEPIPDTEFANGSFTVFGEQRSRKVTAGFLGEIETEKNLTDDDGSFNTETRFIGAADVAITPRTIRWYFGDVLTGVRDDDEVRIADDINENSRNIFITGPSYESEVEGVSSTSARLLYVHQTEDDEEIESIYNFSVSHQRVTTVDSFYGIRFSDIFTQVPDVLDQDQLDALDETVDFNRMAVTAFTSRIRGPFELYGELGATQYKTDDETVNGATALIRAARQYGPRSTMSAGLSHTLSDETLNLVGAALQGGVDGAALQPEVPGIFAETRLDLGYGFERSTTQLNFTLSAAQLNYQLLPGTSLDGEAVDAEDRNVASLAAEYARYLTPRWRAIFGAALQREEYVIGDDYNEGVLVTADFAYTINRRLELTISFAYDTAEGINRRGLQLGADGEPLPGQDPLIDESETRALIGIRWVPPTRASRELTVEVATLIE